MVSGAGWFRGLKKKKQTSKDAYGIAPGGPIFVTLLAFA